MNKTVVRFKKDISGKCFFLLAYVHDSGPNHFLSSFFPTLEKHLTRNNNKYVNTELTAHIFRCRK
jgi:hypothetical protein